MKQRLDKQAEHSEISERRALDSVQARSGSRLHIRQASIPKRGCVQGERRISRSVGIPVGNVITEADLEGNASEMHIWCVFSCEARYWKVTFSLRSILKVSTYGT
jgi:hypothetical protein